MRIDTKILIPALKLIPRPVIHFCLRHSLRIQDLVEVSKALFTEIAQEQLAERNLKPTDAGISVMTGLHRRDVSRFKDASELPDKAHDVISKVMGHWQSDKKFVDSHGKPRQLDFGSERSAFSKLVYSISNDITPSSVLSELERIGAVKKEKDTIRLIENTYVPKGNPINGFKILSHDCDDLIRAVEENILEDIDLPNMHYSTVYDRVDPKAVPQIKRWLLERGNELHLSARQYISQFDLDINPKGRIEDPPKRIVLSSFSLVSPRVEKAQ